MRARKIAISQLRACTSFPPSNLVITNFNGIQDNGVPREKIDRANSAHRKRGGHLTEAILESLLSPIFALVAILYAAVGQAGGTGYIAVMGLIGFAPNVIKPTALALNILVAAIGCARF
jgi:hypothetical protein